MLCLPPIPADFEAFVGVYSVVSLAHKEQAGSAFFERFEVVLDAETAFETNSAPDSSDGADTTSASQPVSTSGVSGSRKKRNFKEGSSISARVRKAIDDEQDLYKLLAADPAASVDDLKRQYKKMALIFHPDKRGAGVTEKGDWPDPAKMTADQVKLHFLGVQNAFEILSDAALRKQYDSSLPFDDALPSAGDITPENFYDVCGKAFLKEAQWASQKPVPKLGDANTPIEQVKRFYKYWVSDFSSWRDFSSHGEYEIEEAQDREERRWMQKENWKVVSKYVKKERDRVLRFVTLAESKDPRVLAEKEAERLRKEANKKKRFQGVGVAARPSQADEAEKKRLADEAKAAADKLALELAEKKKEEKKVLADLRRNVRNLQKLWCQGVLCEFTAEDLQEFLVASGPEWCNRLHEELLEMTKDQTPETHPDTKAAVAKRIRAVMSEFINSRYKSTCSPKATDEKTATATKAARVWTSDELSDLSKALVKFPGGTANRWLQIAQSLGPSFTPDDVITQAKSLNDARNLKSVASVVPATRDPAAAFQQSQKRIPEEKKKVAASLDIRPPAVIEWSIEQQNALEKALVKYPASDFAGNTQQRWTMIAEDVPEKSARDCAMRFKQIFEAIRASNNRP